MGIMASALFYIGGSIFAIRSQQDTEYRVEPIPPPHSAAAGRWQLQMRSIVSVIWMIKYLFSVPAAGHTTFSGTTFTQLFHDF